ncbi:hypothetical protein DFH06DRAFT_1186432 [Mycena polygramma]|nr:hypothetical protein DFH06DRAFT_1186432 [Mycena polygramma]
MSTYTPPANPSPTHQAFLAWVDAVQSNDHATILACYDDSANVSVQVLPASIGLPKMDKAAYSDLFRKSLANFKYIKMTLYEIIEAGSAFTVHAASEGESVSGTPWKNEYIFIIHFTPPSDGCLPKIVSFKEFVDSAAVQKFYAEDAAKAAPVS